ncbi:MAG TPA: agmatinase [Deltaproteobacteria bacterium]|jgi:agmatinase|nr:agmatinase [Deltaproteobacteria bacterium]OQC28091.1 MAG: Agmatinase [Deltaproteobacteria bacterium ADurb.Bin072]NMD41212.1 agmatinase [Deltaproteobacteria bacterium]HNQ84441.1 agmatinase [Deltaproteobacteria bacterium]HNS90161.1 agmatinase [Deltaproteobacteria bacterium]
MASKQDGAVCLFGAPFDSTASFRPGARFGPAAIREASYALETFSPVQLADLEECSFMDQGDLELPFGDPAPALAIIEEHARQIVSGGKTPFLLGGEHLVSLGAVRAAAQAWPDLVVVHLDAHADLRHDYLGMELSHATVMRRILDLLGHDRVRQIGVRSCTREEHGLVTELASAPDRVVPWAGARPCYLTCDLDILDPSVLPGTGTPEPGGLMFGELAGILVSVINRLDVVGLDVVELAPQLDPSGVSSVAAAKIVRECLIALDSTRRRQA